MYQVIDLIGGPMDGSTGTISTFSEDLNEMEESVTSQLRMEGNSGDKTFHWVMGPNTKTAPHELRLPIMPLGMAFRPIEDWEEPAEEEIAQLPEAKMRYALYRRDTDTRYVFDGYRATAKSD